MYRNPEKQQCIKVLPAASYFHKNKTMFKIILRKNIIRQHKINNIGTNNFKQNNKLDS